VGFTAGKGLEGEGKGRRGTRGKEARGTEEGRRNSALVVGGIEPRLLFVANLYLT